MQSYRESFQKKLKDPGSFTIPCTVGQHAFEKALCDLGTSINLMPLSIVKKLTLGQLTPTTLSLHMADCSLTYPISIVEDVLVKIDKFIFPMDFVVLDMEKNYEARLILGGPFLAITQVLIYVQNGDLTVRVGDEHVKFSCISACSYQMKIRPII